jgi:hypothetical protein
MEFDFAQNTTVDSLDTVPENFRGAYVDAGDGKFKVDDRVTGLVGAITGLSGALKKERDTTKTLKGVVPAETVLTQLFGEDVKDVDAAKAVIDDYVAKIATKSNVDPAKIKADIEKGFATERQGYIDKNSKMQGTLEKYLVSNEAATELAAAKGNPVLLGPHIKAVTKVVEENGEYVVRVVDAEGSYRGDGQGGFMGVKGLVAEMKASKDFAAAFESEQKGGGNQERKQHIGAGPGAVNQARQAAANANKSSTDMIASGLGKLTQR